MSKQEWVIVKAIAQKQIVRVVAKELTERYIRAKSVQTERQS